MALLRDSHFSVRDDEAQFSRIVGPSQLVEVVRMYLTRVETRIELTPARRRYSPMTS